jgi:hypothetical protein
MDPMNEPDQLSEPWKDLVDDYLDGQLDEARLTALEAQLRTDADARRYFVRYARLHTDLHLEARTRQASERALNLIDQLEQADAGVRSRRRSLLRSFLAAKVFLPAACLLLAVGAGLWAVKGGGGQDGGRDQAIAWLVNAQNCRWSQQEPTGDMQAGKVLQLERGLAEVCFQCGAKVVMEGPASLELLSGKSARLRHGKLTARVPGPATGFEIISPQGKVIDLGTEFGVSVSDNGATDVYVFEGKVEAHPHSDGKAKAGAMSLLQNEAARIAEGKITREPAAKADQFVRAIVPPPVILPRTLRLAFDRPAEGSIRDANGLGTGLTHRLPGTGSRLREQDPNLWLNPAKGQLQLTTTNSDLNTRYLLWRGEYLGVRLSDLGFTGKEDYAATVTLLDIPALEFVGQFGLYAGPRSDETIRGGLLSAKRQEPGQYTQFLVNNHEGRDAVPNKVGLFSTGSDLRLTLKRSAGKYELTVENLTTESASTLTVPQPDFLDKERDLYVGLFGANTQSEVRKTLTIKEFSVTVWTVQSKE